MINWLDFKSIKCRVTLESVLRHYQVKLRRSGKDQYRGCCPIHRGDGSDAFHVNLARNVFRCFACGAGGTVLDFVAAMEGCSLFDAARRLQSMTSSSTPLTLAPNRKELVTERRKVSSPLNFKLTGIDCAHPYLAGRGITEKTAVEFGVGFYAGPGLMHGRLVIPIHNADGELIAYGGRSVDQTQPRYRLPSAFAKSEILFNMHRASSGRDNFVVVVEGFFDCMKVHQAGVRSVVGLMGFSEISKNLAAEPLDSYPKVLNFIRNTCTRTGLTVSAHLDRRQYPTGTSPDPEQVRRLCLKRHSTLPAWNYTIAPM
jgi:DNA primase